jgi:signal peptidase I
MDDASTSGPANSPDPLQQPPPLRRELRSWTRDLAVALGLAIVVMIFLYQPVKVEGTSMNPLLSDQERIFINKFVYHFEPIERGDVIVFWYPLDRSKSFIKRVVGLPGESIEIRDGHVYINGQELADQYVPAGYLDGSTYAPHHVPADDYFVMGDHRDSSNDSRVFGPVPRQFIYGKAVFAYWPADHFGSLTSTSTVSAASK